MHELVLCLDIRVIYLLQVTHGTSEDVGLDVAVLSNFGVPEECLDEAGERRLDIIALVISKHMLQSEN